MGENAPKWALCLNVDERGELVDAILGVWEAGNIRTVVTFQTGPLDSPEDVLALIIEMIDHAYWKGEQLRFPEPAS